MAYFDAYGVQFTNDCKTLVKVPADFNGKYLIPDGVTAIQNYAFYKCSGLKHVTIPKSAAFIGCHNLISIAIPSSVTRIGVDAFFGCVSIKEIIVPKGEKERFAQMEGLADVASNIKEKNKI